MTGDAPTIVPQRITFVLPTSERYDSRTRRMARDLARRGHEVTVLARSASGEEPPDAIEGVRVIRLAVGGAGSSPATGARVFRLLGELRRMLEAARQAEAQAAAAAALDAGADLYHAMGFLALPTGLRVAKRARAPLVYDARDLYAESTNIARLPRPLRRLFAARERSWARRAARVFTVNEGLATELGRRFGVPRPAVVMNGQAEWTPPSPEPDLLRHAIGLAARTPIALYHGGLREDRGLPQLIAAFGRPELKDAHLVLMGDGPLESELRRTAASSSATARIHFLPPVAPEVLLDWVSSADVSVMVNQPTTLNQRLSTPNKLFESLAAGTPVVSADFPERRRIIADGPDRPLGALCDPTDPGAIAHAIHSILALDEAARADIRARCRKAAAERYGWERQMAVVLAEYGRLTGRPW